MRRGSIISAGISGRRIKKVSECEKITWGIPLIGVLMAGMVMILRMRRFRRIVG